MDPNTACKFVSSLGRNLRKSAGQTGGRGVPCAGRRWEQEDLAQEAWLQGGHCVGVLLSASTILV
eukprot:364664-Chlamydomonas_euryale.AAC.14